MKTVSKKTPEEFASQFRLDNFTSEVYGPKNPPKDWADVSLLVPHETIRREMDRMTASVDKLASRLGDKSYEPWHAVYFCEWFVDVFEPFVHLHHDGEEEFFFPWLAEKEEIPSKKYGKSHEELMGMMKEIGNICQEIIRLKGEGCEKAVEDLKEKTPKFAHEMKGKNNFWNHHSLFCNLVF
jgi:hypothetical protein